MIVVTLIRIRISHHVQHSQHLGIIIIIIAFFFFFFTLQLLGVCGLA